MDVQGFAGTSECIIDLDPIVDYSQYNKNFTRNRSQFLKNI
jgi:hypothetical protein